MRAGFVDGFHNLIVALIDFVMLQIYINSPWPCARLLRDIKFSDSLFDAVTASLNVESYHATANKMHVATQNQQKLLKHHH